MKWDGIILTDSDLDRIHGGGPGARKAMDLAKKAAGLVGAGCAYEAGARVLGALEARLTPPPARPAAPPRPPWEITVHDLLSVL